MASSPPLLRIYPPCAKAQVCGHVLQSRSPAFDKQSNAGPKSGGIVSDVNEYSHGTRYANTNASCQC